MRVCFFWRGVCVCVWEIEKFSILKTRQRERDPPLFETTKKETKKIFALEVLLRSLSLSFLCYIENLS